MNNIELKNDLDSIFLNIESLVKKDMNMLIDINEFCDITNYFSQKDFEFIKNID